MSASVFARLSTAEPPSRTEILMDKAVVLGGSVAGLLAARVLADHAGSVVIVERDELPAAPAPRPGTPHDGQVHGLLPGGRVQLDRFFTGFSDQALAEGAIFSPSERARQYIDGMAKVPDGRMGILSCSRPLLESLIRRRTLELPNVKVITARAHDLVLRGDVVTGVRCAAGTEEWTEEADFVADAMGRASKVSDWLGEHGWESPRLRRLPINVNYATGFFRRAEAEPAIGTAIAYRSPSADIPKVSVAALVATENDRWMVLIAGYGDERPGRTPEEMRGLSAEEPPIFGEATSGELIGDIATYHQSDARRRDYHGLKRYPARLISIGDAVASFNPVYGQGMSSAALQASALSEYLRGKPDLNRPAREFLATQRVVADAAWKMSTAADLARPDIDGPYPRWFRLDQWLTGHVIAASVTDSETAARFNAVTYMLRHPRTLRSPGTLLRAFRVNRRRHSQQA
ncbi:FAD-dependent oxidoreductase [Amycolatopsis sp. NPDC059657]|uniref:FAD-dependent oxidoreductase n=1 Tax=Amycolatopsis sp. NPDC059657 TaxID=3346899 RepID=UPI003672F687